MSDPLAPARGIILALAVSIAIWAVVLAVLGLWR
jgi:hypothetical protein